MKTNKKDFYFWLGDNMELESVTPEEFTVRVAVERQKTFDFYNPSVQEEFDFDDRD